MEVRFDCHCFGCGPLNVDGLRLTFEPGPDGSVAEFEVPDRFQSWAGMAHGGIVALMLDEAVGWAALHAGHPGVTGRLQVSLPPAAEAGEAVRIVVQGGERARTLSTPRPWWKPRRPISHRRCDRHPDDGPTPPWTSRVRRTSVRAGGRLRFRFPALRALVLADGPDRGAA